MEIEWLPLPEKCKKTEWSRGEVDHWRLEHNNGPQLARYSDCRPGPGHHWAIGHLEPVIAVQTVLSSLYTCLMSISIVMFVSEVRR